MCTLQSNHIKTAVHLEVTGSLKIAVVCRRAGYLKFAKDQRQRGSDYEAAARQKSYQLAPRASIFRRDVGTVEDLDSLRRFMRSNSYSNDPVSHSNSPMWMSAFDKVGFEADHQSAA